LKCRECGKEIEGGWLGSDFCSGECLCAEEDREASLAYGYVTPESVVDTWCSDPKEGYVPQTGMRITNVKINGESLELILVATGAGSDVGKSFWENLRDGAEFELARIESEEEGEAD
jgi:hypothetical protein